MPRPNQCSLAVMLLALGSTGLGGGMVGGGWPVMGTLIVAAGVGLAMWSRLRGTLPVAALAAGPCDSEQVEPPATAVVHWLVPTPAEPETWATPVALPAGAPTMAVLMGEVLVPSPAPPGPGWATEAFRQSTDSMVALDAAHLVVEANPAFLHLMGLTEQASVGRPIGELCSGIVLPPVPPPTPMEARVVRSDGCERHVRVRCVAPAGDPAAGVLLVIHDHTREHRNESAAEQPRRMLARLMDHTPAMVAFLDAQGTVMMANAAMATNLGKPAELLLRGHVCNLVHAAVRGEFEAAMAVTAEGNQPVETILVTREGLPLHAHGRLVGFRDGGHEEARLGYLLVLMDRAKEMRAEVDLRRRQQRESELLDHLPDGVLRTGPDGTIRYANVTAARILGVEVGQLEGSTLRDFGASDQTSYVRPHQEGLRQGQEQDWEYEIVRRDGERRQLRVTATPELSATGQFEGELLILRDETERRAAELALIKHYAFSAVLEGISDSFSDYRDAAAVHSQVCEAVVSYCDAAAACMVFRRSDEAPLTEVVACTPGAERKPHDLLRMVQQHCKLSRVIDEGEKVVVTRSRMVRNFQGVQPFPEWATSFVAVPVASTGRLMGVLYAFTPSPNGLPRESIVRLEQLGAQCAAVMVNLMLFEQLEKQNAKLQLALDEARSARIARENLQTYMAVELAPMLEAIHREADTISDSPSPEEPLERLRQTTRRASRSLQGHQAATPQG